MVETTIELRTSNDQPSPCGSCSDFASIGSTRAAHLFRA